MLSVGTVKFKYAVSSRYSPLKIGLVHLGHGEQFYLYYFSIIL